MEAAITEKLLAVREASKSREGENNLLFHFCYPLSSQMGPRQKPIGTGTWETIHAPSHPSNEQFSTIAAVFTLWGAGALGNIHSISEKRKNSILVVLSARRTINSIVSNFDLIHLKRCLEVNEYYSDHIIQTCN